MAVPPSPEIKDLASNNNPPSSLSLQYQSSLSYSESRPADAYSDSECSPEDCDEDSAEQDNPPSRNSFTGDMQVPIQSRCLKAHL